MIEATDERSGFATRRADSDQLEWLPGVMEDRELSDAELSELRGGLSRLVGALMRAWWLGMVSPRDERDQKLFDEISATVGAPTEQRPKNSATPLGIQLKPADIEPSDPDEEEDGLTPVSDQEYLSIVRDLIVRYKMLREAYLRGMITATTPEQELQLAEIQELLDD